MACPAAGEGNETNATKIGYPKAILFLGSTGLLIYT